MNEVEIACERCVEIRKEIKVQWSMVNYHVKTARIWSRRHWQPHYNKFGRLIVYEDGQCAYRKHREMEGAKWHYSIIEELKQERDDLKVLYGEKVLRKKRVKKHPTNAHAYWSFLLE